MSKSTAFDLCNFFINFEWEMHLKGRKNIAAYARRQHRKYFKIAMGR